MVRVQFEGVNCGHGVGTLCHDVQRAVATQQPVKLGDACGQVRAGQVGFQIEGIIAQVHPALGCDVGRAGQVAPCQLRIGGKRLHRPVDVGVDAAQGPLDQRQRAVDVQVCAARSGGAHVDGKVGAGLPDGAVQGVRSVQAPLDQRGFGNAGGDLQVAGVRGQGAADGGVDLVGGDFESVDARAGLVAGGGQGQAALARDQRIGLRDADGQIVAGALQVHVKSAGNGGKGELCVELGGTLQVLPREFREARKVVGGQGHVACDRQVQVLGDPRKLRLSGQAIVGPCQVDLAEFERRVFGPVKGQATVDARADRCGQRGVGQVDPVDGIGQLAHHAADAGALPLGQRAVALQAEGAQFQRRLVQPVDCDIGVPAVAGCRVKADREGGGVDLGLFARQGQQHGRAFGVGDASVQFDQGGPAARGQCQVAGQGQRTGVQVKRVQRQAAIGKKRARGFQRDVIAKERAVTRGEHRCDVAAKVQRKAAVGGGGRGAFIACFGGGVRRRALERDRSVKARRVVSGQRDVGDKVVQRTRTCDGQVDRRIVRQRHQRGQDTAIVLGHGQFQIQHIGGVGISRGKGHVALGAVQAVDLDPGGAFAVGQLCRAVQRDHGGLPKDRLANLDATGLDLFDVHRHRQVGDGKAARGFGRGHVNGVGCHRFARQEHLGHGQFRHLKAACQQGRAAPVQ